jgi:glycosyl transferase family 25
MKAFVVNMLKDTTKREQIEKQLAYFPEINYQIWPAIEGRKLSVQEQKQFILPEFKQRYGKSATLPAAGCSLSHIGIYNTIVETRTCYALILEDDAVLSRELKIDSYIDLLSSSEPVAILLTPDFWYYKRDKLCDLDSQYCVYKVNDGYMTSGYLINNAAASLLASLNYPVQYTADAWSVFMEKGLELYGVVPHLISYPDGIGEIGQSIIVNDSFYQKIRHILVSIYLKFADLRKYLKGMRKSQKKWC